MSHQSRPRIHGRAGPPRDLIRVRPVVLSARPQNICPSPDPTRKAFPVPPSPVELRTRRWWANRRAMWRDPGRRCLPPTPPTSISSRWNVVSDDPCQPKRTRARSEPPDTSRARASIASIDRGVAVVHRQRPRGGDQLGSQDAVRMKVQWSLEPECGERGKGQLKRPWLGSGYPLSRLALSCTAATHCG